MCTHTHARSNTSEWRFSEWAEPSTTLCARHSCVRVAIVRVWRARAFVCLCLCSCFLCSSAWLVRGGTCDRVAVDERYVWKSVCEDLQGQSYTTNNTDVPQGGEVGRLKLQWKFSVPCITPRLKITRREEKTFVYSVSVRLIYST